MPQSDLVERWPGYDEQSWQERFIALDKLHRERTEEGAAIVVKMAHEIERLRNAASARISAGDKDGENPIERPGKGDGEREADEAVDFVFDRLAQKLGLAEWRVVEGSEEWEADVSATLHRLLIDAGIIDEDTGAVATLTTPNDTPVRGLDARPSHPRENVRPAFSDTMIGLLDAYEQRIWTWAQGCEVDGIKQRSEKGDSYNEGQRDDAAEARSALLRQIDALTSTVSVDRERFVATINGRDDLQIDSIAELLRLINGGARIEKIAMIPASPMKGEDR